MEFRPAVTIATTWSELYAFCKTILDSKCRFVFLDWTMRRTVPIKDMEIIPKCFHQCQSIIIHNWFTCTTMLVPSIESLVYLDKPTSQVQFQEKAALVKRLLIYGDLVKFGWHNELIEHEKVSMIKSNIRPFTNLSLFLQIANASHLQADPSEDMSSIRVFESLFHKRIMQFVDLIKLEQTDLWNLSKKEEQDCRKFFIN